ncbi:succinate dehydrogenase subunit D [Aliiroseovarius halocynthiae]|uniref:Succinate dehydrogenase hydrophobic membrane anchor subunit n=1 Tax=Aliiroseovarius halocynthiae TaxID=985055 RepID=A0A545STY2_9RHOB|nr:succinate dehydrogenase, hydrophobic membrane anchor protein [Aliiroseovarius halocynthiae]TQV68419.1 succinate dehydrogenase, hydrophobic membrane anchor protein [Aliiroseovarius halocynthiae]SMR70813.1 succinate dehydrogenase subunit D [Aliiroseovarius halocynthiae]
MQYMTDRKRAVGKGSSGSGTEHFWGQAISAVGLLILMPLFALTFGCALGLPYDEAIAYYQRPFPAIIAAMTFVVSMVHFRHGIQVVIEDYSRGVTKKVLVIACTALAYTVLAVGLYGLGRIAF